MCNHTVTLTPSYQPVSMHTPFLTNLNPQSKEIHLYSPSRELCLSAYWSLGQYRLQIQGSLPCMIARPRQRRERPVLMSAMAQLGAVGKVIRACPRNVAVGMKITKWVYVHCAKPVKHLKPKEAIVWLAVTWILYIHTLYHGSWLVKHPWYWASHSVIPQHHLQYFVTLVLHFLVKATDVSMHACVYLYMAV